MPPITQHSPAGSLNFRKRNLTGLAQLSIVEHSLCPIDPRASLKPQLEHRVGYDYTDPADNRRKTASVTITAHKGFSAKDEHLLWGLLAVTFAQPEPTEELWVSQDYVNRQLGFAGRSERGGWRSYCFRTGLHRLAYLIYDADAFYFPDMNEYRPVVMGILKYDRPQDITSKRPWRITWDSKFFHFCKHTSGGLFFDLATYRELDFASRRLFLLLLKIFGDGRRSPRFDLEQLAVNVLGYQGGLPVFKYKQYVTRSANALLDRGILTLPPGATNIAQTYRKEAVGRYSIRFQPGEYFRKARSTDSSPIVSGAASDSPHYDPLKEIGFSEREIASILRDFPSTTITKAADITLKAIEGGRNVPKIQKHPKAFFRYYVSQLSARAVTPPDWYVESLKREKKHVQKQHVRDLSAEYQTAYQAEFEAFLQGQEGTDRYQHLKQVFLARHMMELSPEQAERAARQDLHRQLEADFEFPDESIWLRQRYEGLKGLR
jgi:hypothetical protein